MSYTKPPQDLDSFVTAKLSCYMEFVDETENVYHKHTTLKEECQKRKKELLDAIDKYDYSQKYSSVKEMLTDPSEFEEKSEPVDDTFLSTLQKNVKNSDEFCKKACENWVKSIWPSKETLENHSKSSHDTYFILSHNYNDNMKYRLTTHNNEMDYDKCIYYDNCTILIQSWKKYIFEYAEKLIKDSKYNMGLNFDTSLVSIRLKWSAPFVTKNTVPHDPTVIGNKMLQNIHDINYKFKPKKGILDILDINVSRQDITPLIDETSVLTQIDLMNKSKTESEVKLPESESETESEAESIESENENMEIESDEFVKDEWDMVDI
jgi:hypothetical protein